VCDRQWWAAVRYALGARGEHPGSLRSVLFPIVARRARDFLTDRALRPANWRASWLTPAFERWDPTQEAISCVRSFLREDRYAERVRYVLASGATAGATTRRRLLDAACSVESVSPFFRRSVVELAVSLPADVRIAPLESKPFLRDAARTRLPPRFFSRPKSQSAYIWLLQRRLASVSLPEEVRSLLRNDAFTSSLVSLPALQDVLDVRNRHLLSLRTAERLCGLIELLRWLRRSSNELGARWRGA
jgi:hypothetical protein